MKYLKAMKVAIFHDWSCGIKQDAICGNGFQVTGYGLKLILSYLMHFTFRIIFALLFPLSAFVVMKIRAYNKLVNSK